MELRLEIVSFQKTLMGDGQARVFDETGGSIGRGRENSWVLPDPNRYVSTRHAEIDFADGRFRVTDVSTNGVFVNGSASALGRDGRAVLSDGDRLVIGDYEIAVRLVQRAASSPPVAPPRPGIGGDFGAPRGQAAPDILDVVGRRAEPRLGHREIPEDPAAFRTGPAAAAQAVPSRPLGPEPSRRLAADPPMRANAALPPAPLPPSPPRPTRASPALPPAGGPPGIPDDDDLIGRPIAAASSPPLPQAPAPPPVTATRPLLPDDLDDLLPGGPELPRTAAPPVPGQAQQRPPLPDDLDDFLPAPATRPAEASPAGILPEGVPLLRPVPGTGNRQEPLSPAPPAMLEEADRRPPPAATRPPSPPLQSPPPPSPPPQRPISEVATTTAAMPVGGDAVAALAEGLGLDPRTLGGLDPRATAVTVARAARAAALGIAGAIDARNALARAAGIDAREFGGDGDNPFLTYRSGEAALRHCVSGATPGQTLDSATRESVTALTNTATAAAVALDTVLDRLAADGPPGSAERVREIFGAAFLNAYHRETSRSG